MSTDERIVALEQGLADVKSEFLVYLSENNRQIATLNKVITSQAVNGRDVDHNLTMLIGIVSGQGIDIKAARADLSVVKESVESIDQRLTNVEQGIQQVLQKLVAISAKLGPDV